ncbi:MAG: SDR family oxidoreductase [Dissulfurispiraceae bacterium]
MNEKKIHVVTGAFGFSGKYIAKRLLDAGLEVRTLTNSPQRENPFGGLVKAYHFNFNDPEKLGESLRGATVLYNTYWVRFNYDGFSFSLAVANTIKLFEAAKKEGIRRIVHISILNASESSSFEYFKDKAVVESLLKQSGLSYAILRPAALFGKEDILINNIAWFLRHFPVFDIFGNGNYKLQPIYVDDMACMAVEEGLKEENHIIDAIGPETFTYKELVRAIGRAIGKERLIMNVSPEIGYIASTVVGKLFGDVTITWDEIRGLMVNLLYTDSPATGTTKLSDYLKENASTIGLRYASELARRKNRLLSYEHL